MLIEQYREQVRMIVAGRPWIVTTGVVVSSLKIATQLRGLGATKVLAIGISRGTGSLENDDESIQLLNFGMADVPDMMDAIRLEEQTLGNLPDDVLSLVRDFDPTQQARVVGNIYSGHEWIAGRKTIGYRPKSWQNLEDKMIVDKLWDQAGVRRAPSRIVTLSECSFDILWTSMVPRYDWGSGTVWVGDNKSGWHGGAKMLRWVRDKKDARNAYEFFADSCDTIRMMPFMDGIPCSIHGWVFKDKTIGLRPCEMLIFQREGISNLTYSGASTNWKPSEPYRQEMVDSVVKVGDHLRETVGYRGSFTMDGVMTIQGFMPTELNPRFGGALNRMSASLPDLPLYLLHLCTIEDPNISIDPESFRRLIVEAAERNPIIRGMYVLEGLYGLDPDECNVLLDQSGQWYRAPKNSQSTACVLRLGAATAGTFVFADVPVGYVSRGDSAAPILASLFAFAGEYWSLSIPRLIPSKNTEIET